MSGQYAVLTGGVGGAKLVEGLYRLLPADSLTAIVNTGDDFRHYGLPISPDIDTLLYTLSGKANQKLGWGREGESWNFMEALRSLGGDDWFNLGDGDLALHILRGAALAEGTSLSEITQRFAKAWELALDILPMSNDSVESWVETDEGPLSFQQYFVKRQCAPKLQSVHFKGAKEATPAAGVITAIMDADAVFIAPSNPWLSIDPILAIPAIRQALDNCKGPVVAVSPLIEGKAVKGPTAKLMNELGLSVDNQSIAAHYDGWIDAMLVHNDDAAPKDIQIARTDTLMQTSQDRTRVAKAALVLAGQLRS